MKVALIALVLLSPLDYIREAATTHGVDYNWLRHTAVCESQLDPTVTSKNKLYHGLYQFSWRTWNWMSQQAGWSGYSPYDPQAAAHVTAWAFRNGYRSHWPRCSYI